MSVSSELAARIGAMRYVDLPEVAIHWAKVALLDTIGVTLAGAREPTARIAADVLDVDALPGPALVLGGRTRTRALDAALVNGAAAHALDFDDCNNTIGGHPSVPILPALIALAEERHASGHDVLLAYVTGFEVETRIARAVHFHHYEKGWHPTATIGIFGCAAACARLLGLDAARTATALAIAASFASGLKSNFGTMTKPLHVGHCTRNGLFAALLAERGYTAGNLAFEHRQGFFEVFNGTGNYDASKIFAQWAAPLDIIRPGIAIKQYPCCGSTHPAIDAAIALHDDAGIDVARIARIESYTHARRLAHTNRPHPDSALDAKFSVQYCVARALIDGKVTVDHFEDGRWNDPRVLELATRVAAAPYTAGQFPVENHFGAEVRVHTTDGRCHVRKVDQPHGRTSDNPLSADQLRIKFESCAARVLDIPRIDALYVAIQAFEQVVDVREFTQLLEPPAVH